MRKCLLIIIATIFFQCSFSQDDTGKRTQHDFDSLKLVLPKLFGNDRVDCLNALASKACDLPLDSWKFEADTARPYATAANKEAKQIGYRKGLGQSFANLETIDCMMFGFYAQTQRRFDDPLFNSAQQNAKEAISIGEELKDYDILGEAYFVLSWLVGETKNSSRSISNIDYIKKAIEYFGKTDNKVRLAWSLREFYYQSNNSQHFEEGVDAIKKAIALYHELGDQRNEFLGYKDLCSLCWNTGDFENGFEAAKKAVTLTQKLADRKNQFQFSLGQSLFWMSLFYETAGEYQTALSVIQQARPYVNEGPLFKDVWSATIGDIYRLLGKYDSASYYLNPFNTDADPSLLGRKNLSRLYIDLGDYDKALSLINSLIEIKNYPADPDSRGVLFTISASACFGKKDYTSALKFAREGLPMLKAGHRKVRMIDNYELLAKIFHCLRKDDSAYYYQTRFYEMKDSIVNRQFLWRLNNYKNEADEEKKTSQINLLNKENQLKDQKLKQQALVRNSLVGGFILLFLLALVIFRNLSLKRKKERAELQKKGSELEMQALRAQMNPHFIFNCLSSINKFILKEDTDTASDYLTRFSRLIRMVLTNSQLSLIPLSDEIEMVRLYLEMERLRFSDSFDYNIIYENTIESETIYIPPMLLQPFCENAIWHGLMHKQGQGKLDVTMSVVNDQLQCVIADNGIGREKAAEMKTKSGVKQKSFGLKITTERLALFNNEKSADSFFRTEDVLDQDGNISGTKVILNIKLKQQATTQTINEPA